MNTEQALAQLGVHGNVLTEEQIHSLEELGYFTVENAFSAEQIKSVGAAVDELMALEGEQGGHEVHTEKGAPRLSNVLNKSPAFDICLECKPLLAAAVHLLGPEIKVHGFNARDAAPDQGHQPLHSDAPQIEPGDWRVVNSLILIDPYTEFNGPTRVVPGTHKTGQRCQDRLPDPLAPHPEEIHLTAPAGTVFVLNAHTWHGGTKNMSGERRRVLHLSYTRRDLPQQLVQRDHVTAELHDRMNAAHRYLLDI